MRYITEAIKLMDAQQTRTALEHKSKGIHLKADHLSPFYENRQKIFFPLTLVSQHSGTIWCLHSATRLIYSRKTRDSSKDGPDGSLRYDWITQ